jgi:hypothetical protein
MSAIAGNIRTSSSACRAVRCRAQPRTVRLPVPRGTHGAAARAAAAAQRWRCAKAESFAFGCESLSAVRPRCAAALCARMCRRVCRRVRECRRARARTLARSLVLEEAKGRAVPL